MSVWRVFTLAALLLLLAACASGAPDSGEASMKRDPSQRVSKHQPLHRPTIALVLGGGGVRGFAHVGAIQALEEAGIDADLVVGTSVGSVVGALYAAGRSSQELLALAREVRTVEFADWTFRGNGLLEGVALERWIDRQVASDSIENLPRQYIAVATDLRTGATLEIDSGSVGFAVRASSSIPGVFRPARMGDDWLVDGGLTNILPVRVARRHHPEVIIAVDVYCHERFRAPTSSAGVLTRSMQLQSCKLSEEDRRQADLMVTPRLEMTNRGRFDQREALIAAGRLAMDSALRDTCDKGTSLSKLAREVLCFSQTR